jgi:hypothetical protein
METLVDSLRSKGHTPIVLAEKIVVLPFGGRILGVFPDGRHNLFWVNPEYSGESPSGAGDALSGTSDLTIEGWCNCGGDRTWICPEVEANVGDPADFGGTYEVPEAVDPARYEVVSSDAMAAVLRTPMELEFRRSKHRAKLEVTKRIAALTAAPSIADGGLDFCGYELETTLAAESDLGPARPGIWNLIQAVGGGEIIVPVKEGASPRAFIGDPVYAIYGGLLRCKAATKASFKFCIKASQSTGRVCYLQADAEPATLIVRTFEVGNEADYTDVPPDDLADGGYAQEIYVDDGGFGGFAELEYVCPSLAQSGPRRSVDRSTVWAFSGKKDAIVKLCEEIASA